MRGKIPSSDSIRILRELRRRGYSWFEISQWVGIPKTTVRKYAHDIEILPDAKSHLSFKSGGSHKLKMLRWSATLSEYKSLVGSLTSKEKLLFLSAIYWGEGSKHDFGLVNSDPILIKMFVNGLRELFKIDNSRIRVSIRIYNDIDEKVAKKFWSEILNIPEEDFGRTDLQIGKKNGKLIYGMCRVRVLRGADLLSKVKAVNQLVAQQFAPMA